MDERAREVARQWVLAQPAVSAYVASLVREFNARDDILQDVAVAVLDHYASYDHARPFVAWAIGIARNQVLAHFRRKGRDRLVFEGNCLDRIEAAFAQLRPTDIRALDALGECVESLEGRARHLCELRYRDDLTPAAIAQRTGMTANNVAKALQRVRETLRACVTRKLALDGG